MVTDMDTREQRPVCNSGISFRDRFERCLLRHLAGTEYPDPYDDDAWASLDIEETAKRAKRSLKEMRRG